MTRKKRQMLPILLLFLLISHPIWAAKSTLYTDLQASFPANNNDDNGMPRVYPFLLFTTPSIGGGIVSGRFFVAGLYNSARFSWDSHRAKNGYWNFFFETKTTLIYAGDSPVLDGRSVSASNFNANMWGNNAGAQYLFKLFGFEWRVGARYDADFYFPYGNTDASVFIRPDFFVDQGPTLFLESRDIPPIDLVMFGIYPLAKLEERFRNDLSMWGPVGATSNVENYFRPSALVPFGIPFSKRVILTGRAFGAAVSDVDRINSIKFGSMMTLGNSTTNLPGPGMYANEVFAKWIYGGSIGPRFILDREAKSLFVIYPFIHGARYNELLPSNALRSNGVGGAGIRVMGRVKKKFFWDVGYACAYGLQRQSRPANEVYVHLLWIPWEKEMSPNTNYESERLQ